MTDIQQPLSTLGNVSRITKNTYELLKAGMFQVQGMNSEAITEAIKFSELQAKQAAEAFEAEKAKQQEAEDVKKEG